ncbi:MAG TPA: acylphosphatase [Dissulfurispiraceae bacterium]|nr:acylphosphatase [Dissulfurispiraceae bacterium]
MKTRAHLFISGKVQKVGFRVFVSEVALSHNLTGYVMNSGNSEIEAVFEGEKESIKSAIRKCKEGIPSAKVEIVDANWEEKPENLTTFMIRY